MVHVHVNTVPGGSTGGIMLKQHRELLKAGADSYVFWGRGRCTENELEARFNSRFGVAVDALMTRLDGRAGFHSERATKRLLKRLDEINPDVVHLHNLHGYYINVELLFAWLRERRCKVEWTLHDCWAFTGHCSHFSYVGCCQWEDGCACSFDCPQLGVYPKTLAGSASCKWSFEKKRELFNSIPIEQMELIVPSRWLARFVGKSFLSRYPVKVRNNAIDVNAFKPTPSDFRERFGVGSRFMILGVASPWTDRKGLGDFEALAEALDPDKYAIVLIGLSKKQIKRLRNRLIALPKTNNASALAEAYSAADLFVHPGIEETFGLTVAEAQACGTRVMVAKGSACAEIASPELAIVVPAGYSNLQSEIERLAGMQK